MDNNYAQHQMGTPVWLAVRYWVEDSKDPRTIHVLMVGSSTSFAHPDGVEALVLSETGALTPITKYMRNIEATMFQVFGVSTPKVQGSR